MQPGVLQHSIKALHLPFFEFCILHSKFYIPPPPFSCQIPAFRFPSSQHHPGIRPDIPVNPPRPVPLFRLLVASFVIFVSSAIVAETIEWTDHFAGFKSSYFSALLFAIAWLGLVLPLNLIVGGLYHWRRWQRGRAWFVLGPSLLVFTLIIAAELIDPPTASARFQHDAGMPLPPSAENVQHYFRGLGVGGMDEYFYFRCQPADTQSLIKTLGLKPADGARPPDQKTLPPAGFPNPQIWPAPKTYRLDDQTNGLFIELTTDESNRQVLLHFIGK